CRFSLPVGSLWPLPLLDAEYSKRLRQLPTRHRASQTLVPRIQSPYPQRIGIEPNVALGRVQFADQFDVATVLRADGEIVAGDSPIVLSRNARVACVARNADVGAGTDHALRPQTA